ncbi:hypothetical protein [Candidatus Nitrosocosmicus sp. SS]|nr:hypothetical protein [Candidatus Nitrosocosmicus sp. SS]KAA2282975.1 hypothetical protein F1Z66_04750 [Candidatus Nitrosocosmicus sp. SS]KAF0869178.1 hypothetical protein E5N71_07030 [Candidatus Nitrosocosmicus sp. SS]
MPLSNASSNSNDEDDCDPEDREFFGDDWCNDFGSSSEANDDIDANDDDCDPEDREFFGDDWCNDFSSSSDDSSDEQDDSAITDNDDGDLASQPSLEPEEQEQQDNFQSIPDTPENDNLLPAQESGKGLNDNCLKSGFSQERCNNMLFSDDPGGYCTTLKMGGLPCPKIQDPAFTYGNPEAARFQSEQQIENTERAIQEFDDAVPNDLGQGFADN